MLDKTEKNLNDKVFVASDSDTLKTVLIHPLGNETKHVIPKFGYLNQLGFSADILGDKAQEHHNKFVKIIKDQGVNILITHELINNALSNLNRLGLLNGWIIENFPTLNKLLEEKLLITSEDLIGSSNKSYYYFNPENEYDPLSRPLQGMYYTRDFAVVLPEGVLLTSFGNRRILETKLAKLMFKYSDQLKDIPIIFDAEEEGVLIQGGDLIVWDENTLIMGIDNLSERKAAELIAKQLNKTIIGVKLPTPKLVKSGAPFSSFFLHLDTIFNVLDEDKVLIAPYFFENRFKESNPIYSILNNIKLQLSEELQKDFDILVEELEFVGDVTIFEARTGKQTKTGKKLTDYMREDLQQSIINVGGDIPDSFEEQVKHMIEVILPEIRFQAGNVVVIRPGEVIIYKDNTLETQKALTKAGVKIIPIDGYELARWNGGPHCMTMPLKRG